jgi:DNA helicase-2/ATP-dependent DNA helicase PcrA
VKRAAQAAEQMGVSLFEALRRLGSDGNRDLGTAARRKVKAFVELMDELIRLSAELEPAELAEETLRSSGYMDDLAEDGTPTAQARMENLLELTGSIRTYQKEAEEPSLQGWLEQVALTADVDGHQDSSQLVTLMTVHAAKGLEFPEVVVTGLEEGLFPHGRGLYDPEELEEERRLAYVAFTRARRELHVTRARSRWLMGQYHDNAPARFLSEIPKHLVKETTPFGRTTGKGGVPVFEDVGEMEWDGNEAVGVEEKSVGGADEETGWYEERLAKNIPENRDEMYVEIPEFHVEEPPSAGAGGWFVGMEVKHKKFGVGRVQAWYGEPPRQKISVYFPVHGHKTIVASYLEKN